MILAGIFLPHDHTGAGGSEPGQRAEYAQVLAICRLFYIQPSIYRANFAFGNHPAGDIRHRNQSIFNPAAYGRNSPETKIERADIWTLKSGRKHLSQTLRFKNTNAKINISEHKNHLKSL